MATEEFKQRRDELYKLMRHECEPHLQLRLRSIPGQARPAFAYQCQQCGEQRGGSVSRAKASEILEVASAQPFDETTKTGWEQRRSAMHDEWMELGKRIADKKSVPENEPSDIDLWRSATSDAEKLLENAGANVAQAVGLEQASATLMKVAIAFGNRVRDQQLGHMNRFRSEQELCAWLDHRIEEDFEVHRQVDGHHMTVDKQVRIDYVLFPKSHLVNAGFAECPIGVEAKYLDQDGGFSRKMTRAVWQAVSYMDSTFALPAGEQRLKAVLLFTNLSFEQEHAILRLKNSRKVQSDSSEWAAATGVANHRGVGELQIFGSRDNWRGWCISFGGGAYFRRVEQRTGTRYVLGNAGLLGKVRIGNF